MATSARVKGRYGVGTIVSWGGYTPLFVRGQVVVAVVLLLTACSGDQDSAPTVEEAPVDAPESSRPGDAAGPYTCPHPPTVVTRSPSVCPHCKMDLVPQQGTGVFICRDHLEAVDVRPGTCRVCDRLLVSAPLASLWRCAHHPEVEDEEADSCPVCGRQLAEVPVGEVWVCPLGYLESLGDDRDSTALGTLRLDGGPLGFATEEVALREGRCAICGGTRLRVLLTLPHGDHEPRYGGQFRMASDYWHHIELVLAEPGVLRLYFFDNYTRPLDASGFDARAFRSRMDPTEGLIDGTTPRAFTAVDGESYLEARLEESELPLQILLKVRLGERDERFDFVFRELARPTSDPDDGTPLVPRAEDDVRIPAAPGDIVVEILIQDLRLRQRIARQDYDSVHLPAFRAKDLALALEERVALRQDEDPGRHRAVCRAVRCVVRGAWLVDFHGDLGDRPRLLEHYRTFARGVVDLRRLFPLLPHRVTDLEGDLAPLEGR